MDDTVPEKKSTKSKRSYIQPIWIKLLNNYRDIMNDLHNLTNEDIRFNVAETSRTIRINIFTEGTTVKYRITSNCYSLQPKTEHPLKHRFLNFFGPPPTL